MQCPGLMPRYSDLTLSEWDLDISKKLLQWFTCAARLWPNAFHDKSKQLLSVDWPRTLALKAWSPVQQCQQNMRTCLKMQVQRCIPKTHHIKVSLDRARNSLLPQSLQVVLLHQTFYSGWALDKQHCLAAALLKCGLTGFIQDLWVWVCMLTKLPGKPCAM